MRSVPSYCRTIYKAETDGENLDSHQQHELKLLVLPSHRYLYSSKALLPHLLSHLFLGCCLFQTLLHSLKGRDVVYANTVSLIVDFRIISTYPFACSFVARTGGGREGSLAFLRKDFLLPVPLRHLVILGHFQWVQKDRMT